MPFLLTISSVTTQQIHKGTQLNGGIKLRGNQLTQDHMETAVKMEEDRQRGGLA